MELIDKAVLISVRPQYCEKIANREKTLEVRKNRPKLKTPFKCYIYCTKAKPAWFRFSPLERLDGKIICEFICDNIRCFDVPYPAFQSKLDKSILADSCCTYYMLHRYAYHDALYGWHISDLKIYDKPRELSEFKRETGILEHCAGQCETCNHWRYARVNSEEYDMECECGGPLFNVLEPITRAPQSWCYVEEAP